MSGTCSEKAETDGDQNNWVSLGMSWNLYMVFPYMMTLGQPDFLCSSSRNKDAQRSPISCPDLACKVMPWYFCCTLDWSNVKVHPHSRGKNLNLSPLNRVPSTSHWKNMRDRNILVQSFSENLIHHPEPSDWCNPVHVSINSLLLILARVRFYYL